MGEFGRPGRLDRGEVAGPPVSHRVTCIAGYFLVCVLNAVVPYVPYLACSDLVRYGAIRTVPRLPCVVYTRWNILLAG